MLYPVSWFSILHNCIHSNIKPRKSGLSSNVHILFSSWQKASGASYMNSLFYPGIADLFLWTLHMPSLLALKLCEIWGGLNEQFFSFYSNLTPFTAQSWERSMACHHGRFFFFFLVRKLWGIVISSVASGTHLSSDHSEVFAVIMETKMLCSVENTGCS